MQTTLSLRRLTRVIDGNTILTSNDTPRGRTSKLYGIDAPIGDQNYGREASDALMDLMAETVGGNIYIQEHGRDPDGIVMVTIFTENEPTHALCNINYRMVLDGHAWTNHFKYIDTDSTPIVPKAGLSAYDSAEAVARMRGLGLWAEKFAPSHRPTYYREQKKLEKEIADARHKQFANAYGDDASSSNGSVDTSEDALSKKSKKSKKKEKKKKKKSLPETMQLSKGKLEFIDDW